MFFHLMKLIWNRKRSNALLILEIFLAFLVVFTVVTGTFQSLDLYLRPLGFDWHDVWTIQVLRPDSRFFEPYSAEEAPVIRGLILELESLEPVRQVAASTHSPYQFMTVRNELTYKDRDYLVEEGSASDRFDEVLGLHLIAGRWFEPADAALDWEPIVINRTLARELFGDEDPIGRRLERGSQGGEVRVVGLLDAFRHHGEFNEEGAFYFRRIPLEAEEGLELAYLHIRLAPGTSADFEETLTRRLQAIAPGWTFTIQSLEAAREDHFRDAMIPLSIGAIVAGFLLLMVVLGLTGVLWQNVTRRTREIGLRRAMGACRTAIHRQVVAEVKIMAGFGLIVGAVVVVQIPLLGPFSFLSFDVVFAALAVSAAIMLLLAGACGFYPGWTATRVQPADALHYE